MRAFLGRWWQMDARLRQRWIGVVMMLLAVVDAIAWAGVLARVTGWGPLAVGAAVFAFGGLVFAVGLAFVLDSFR